MNAGSGSGTKDEPPKSGKDSGGSYTQHESITIMSDVPALVILPRPKVKPCGFCAGESVIVGKDGSQSLCPRCCLKATARDRNQRLIRRALDYSRARQSARFLLVVMAAHADLSHVTALPASTLAKFCRTSVSSIHRDIRQLIDLGEIERVQKGGGRGQVSAYRVTLNCVTRLT